MTEPFRLIANQDPNAVEIYSQDNNVPYHVAAIKLRNHGMIKREDVWPEPLDHEQVKKIANPDLCGQRSDILTRMADAINGYLQFPRSTIFAHGLGCIASAMCKAFRVGDEHYNIPVLLYVVTAQPPSTGKSEVNRRLYSPVNKAISEENEKTRQERTKLKRIINTQKRIMESAKTSDIEFDEAEDKLWRAEKRLAEIPEWQPAFTNATQEAIEESLKDSGGMFTIASAEAEALNVAMGASYGDNKQKMNMDLFLKAWDGDENYNSARISRGGFQGVVRGSIAVLAQDDTIDTMLQAGSAGRGITERFLMLSERPLLGHRDLTKKPTYETKVFDEYAQLISNIFSEEKVVLTLSDDARQYLSSYTATLEPTMQEGGENSDNLATGFIGKADKQIKRIASVLHAIEHWKAGGDRSTVIDDDTIMWAVSCYDLLAKSFLNAADYLGYSGNSSMVSHLCSYFINKAGRGDLKVSVENLRNNIKKSIAFKGVRGLQKKLKDDLFPMLERLNYIYVDNKTIYINPRLK